MSLLKYKAKWEKLAYKVGMYKTDAEALAAVTRNGYALKYVINQTEEICLAAVQQIGYALQYVHNQTDEICLAAVTRNGGALQFVHPEFFKIKDNDDIIALNDIKYKKIGE